MNNKKHKNKYNHYTEAFRREAVRRSEDPNSSATDIAKELGIHPGQIYNWLEVGRSGFYKWRKRKPSHGENLFVKQLLSRLSSQRSVMVHLE